MKNKMMKTIFTLIICMTSCIRSNASDKNNGCSTAYAESVHMYICIEAMKLLKLTYPNADLSAIENRIGTTSDIGSRPWQTGKIITGAYREDVEDVVFDIRGPMGLFASCSHFMNADDRTDGDHSLTHLEGVGIFPNAYTKITRYLNGQWFKWSGGYQHRLYINYLHTNGMLYRYSYHTRGLINFYKTKIIFLHSISNTLGQEEFIDEEVMLSDYVFNKIIWEIIGRMSHDLQDMTVPAHTHSDVHIRFLDGGDCYHNFIDDGSFNNYNAQTAKNEGGIINPYLSGDDPLRYLMYAANQIADHYPSGPDCLEIPQQHYGDNNLPGGTYPIISQFYQQAGPPPQNIFNLNEEGRHCFNFAIRATAGLLYWFAVETGILPPEPAALPVIISFTKNLPDNTIYRSEVFNLTCNASGSNLTYNWFCKVCRDDNWCTAPINGLTFNSNTNNFYITNNNFNNRWTCSFYDSLCNAGDKVISDHYENPLKLIVGVTVSNQLGQMTKYYDLYTQEKILPFNGIRPLNPPVICGASLFSGYRGSYEFENNILHTSVFSEDQSEDVTDMIVISEPSQLDTSENTVTFAIKILGSDSSYIDNVCLISIDHEADMSVAVSDPKRIVIFNRAEVRSPVYAGLNGEDITEKMSYDSAFGKAAEGSDNDIIDLRFASNPGFASDSMALILDPRGAGVNNIFNPKGASGYISVFDSAGNKITEDIDFSRKVKRSAVLLPLNAVNNFSRATLTFKDGFSLSYCAAVKFSTTGFTTIKHELIKAGNSIKGDELKNLSTENKVYATLDSNSFITFTFKIDKSKKVDNMKRDYVLLVKGRSSDNGSMLYDFPQTENIIIQDTESEPDNFLLEQNYPNPFNPVTTIRYTLSGDQFVNLKIFNAQGKEVADLINGIEKSGSHEVKFDGSNMPSGVYYYRLKTNGFMKIRKMVILK